MSPRKVFWLFIGFLVVLFGEGMPGKSFGDTIHFKSGEKVEGDILATSNKSMLVRLENGEYKTYALEEVEKFENGVDTDFETGDKEKNILHIRINPMIELDFKAKSEIYNIRKQYVSLYAGLTDGNYEPSNDVFGQIVDGKTWWGILGITHFGPGENSIAGLSEESRFLCNPFLFVGLCEDNARIVNNPELSPKAIYPEPLRLEWNKEESLVKVTYDITSYWREQHNYHFSGEEHDSRFVLIAYNARDFGFNYLYVVPEESDNITSMNKIREPVLINQYIHCGGSSGYPGGSNNMSPRNPALKIDIHRLPAKAYIKLWRKEPENVDVKPDKIVIIEMI